MEFAHGRDVLTGSYNEVMRLLQQVDKVAGAFDMDPEESLLFLLQARPPRPGPPAVPPSSCCAVGCAAEAAACCCCKRYSCSVTRFRR